MCGDLCLGASISEAYGRLLVPHPNVLVLPPKREETGKHVWESPASHHTEQQNVRASLLSLSENPRDT